MHMDVRTHSQSPGCSVSLLLQGRRILSWSFVGQKFDRSVSAKEQSKQPISFATIAFSAAFCGNSFADGEESLWCANKRLSTRVVDLETWNVAAVLRLNATRDTDHSILRISLAQQDFVAKMVHCFDLFGSHTSSNHRTRSLTFESIHEEEDNDQQSPLLVEIVGALGVRHHGDRVNPSVVVKTGGGTTELHRTKAIPHDGNPIWTVLTKSLFVLEVPTDATTEDKTKDNQAVRFDVCDGAVRLGTLVLTHRQLRENATGQRMEYQVTATVGAHHTRATLALRIQPATVADLEFLAPSWTGDTSHAPALATDMNFKEVKLKNFFQHYKKKDRQGRQLYRCMPGPDPRRPPEETEWMTAAELTEAALEPSREWVHAGQGTIGKVYLEILGCDGLPDMDIAVNKLDVTDPFCAVAFEDNLVRTAMLWDDQNPRWMPWTMRAFCFHVSHPTSLLMVGVFDYDETPMDGHDPVGRVVINTANYYSNTEYLLRYNLHHDPRQMDQTSRGTILIRLRLEWTSEVQAMKASYTSPPKCIINCQTSKAHEVLRYLTRGAVDMEEPTVNTVKLYAAEVTSYWQHYCYFLDIMFEIFLWRGRWHLSDTKSFWFPIHSVAFAASILISLEYPHLAGAMFFYLLAWVMLSINFFASRHPNPWKRVKRSEETNLVVLTGHSFANPDMQIVPDEGVELGKVVDKVDEIRGARMSKLISACIHFLLQINEIYSKTSVGAKFFSTQSSGWNILSGRLHSLHMMLKMICTYARLYVSLINWQGYYANKLTTTLVLLGTICMLPPVHFIAWWVVRIVAWTVLGPWMKFVDVYWVHGWYKTSDELLQLVLAGVEPDPDLPDFNSLLESDVFLKMSLAGRVIGENALKLKDMRAHVFGAYCEVIPAVDASRVPSVPLPSSSACPYDPVAVPNSPPTGHTYVVGQKLSGTMIMKQSPLAADEGPAGTAAQDATRKKYD
jgi:hypothetical protein